MVLLAPGTHYIGAHSGHLLELFLSFALPSFSSPATTISTQAFNLNPPYQRQATHLHRLILPHTSLSTNHNQQPCQRASLNTLNIPRHQDPPGSGIGTMAASLQPAPVVIAGGVARLRDCIRATAQTACYTQILLTPDADAALRDIGPRRSKSQLCSHLCRSQIY